MQKAPNNSPVVIPEVIDWQESTTTQQQKVLQRPPLPSTGLNDKVSAIIDQVKSRGDAALLEYTLKFDQVALQQLEVSEPEWAAAEAQVSPEVVKAVEDAIERIDDFHTACKPSGLNMETAVGLRCEARFLPISPVGLYVPGGSAPLISTVIMLAVPARIAGCSETVMCTPPDANGMVAPAILLAASRCGVKRVFKVGGAQAIAAMGIGTESIPACAKLFGPGNAWVTEAKQQIAAMPGGAARDMPAGPSEVLVVTDASADARAVCWDLLSQAEHGPDSQAILISTSAELLAEVQQYLPELAATLPRLEILRKSLKYLRLIHVDSMRHAIQISNEYAPEHLIINCKDADRVADGVTAAGSVFIGPWTPESLGDYCSGTNHVLPTYGYARAYSGLSVSDFMRRMTLQRASNFGLRTVGPCAITLAREEGLEAHAMAVQYRLDHTNGDK
jgi:histidinol dehydrogenase